MNKADGNGNQRSPVRRILRSAVFVLGGAALGYIGNLAYIQMGST